MVTIILGAQWGDEGKGKITDLLSEKADIVARYNGGNNAGHTVINEYGKFGLHLLPTGIFHKQALSLITNGVVIDPEVLVSEISLLEGVGIKLKDRLFISPRCHLIMPYHKTLDVLYESAKGKGKTGTTGRGIGPVVADKVSYNGIRISDLLDEKIFKEKLSVQLALKNKMLAALGGPTLSLEEIVSEYTRLGNVIKPFVKETFPIIQDAIGRNKQILLEGAQGIFLDNDWGTYPFVTASTIVSGGATSGAGIAPKHLTNIVGVAKAYVTRVGDGPFPTELTDETGKQLAKVGHEFGTTTGRQRRCGWFDAEMVRFAAVLNGFTELIITKLDVLDSSETIKICTGYSLNGKTVGYVNGDAEFLKKVKPVYKEMKGWKKSTKGITKFADLPKEAKAYIETIEKLVGVRVSYISNGPKRDEIIRKQVT